MSAISHDVRTMWALARFFAGVYLSFVCMSVAPTDRLRRWGTKAWWVRFWLGPAWPPPLPAGSRQGRPRLLLRAVRK